MGFNPNRKLDSAHDLSAGERAYLREQGVKQDEFDRMDARAQREWKDEMRDPHYEDMRNFEKHVKMIKK
jgi:hypothetical protein